MEFQYLKPIFKNKRSIMDIWGAITYKKKSLVYFLIKKRPNNIRNICWLDFLITISFFYKEFLRKIGKIIYIDNNATYYISKLIKKFCVELRFLYMIWLVQFLDLNFIKNF